MVSDSQIDLFTQGNLDLTQLEGTGGKSVVEQQLVEPQTVEVAVNEVEAVEAVSIEQQLNPNVAISEDDLDLFARGMLDITQLETRGGRGGRRRERGEDPGGQA